MIDLKGYRVLVTPTSYGKNDPNLFSRLEAEVGEVVYNTLGRPLKATDLLQIIGDFDGYIAGLDEINRQVMEAAPRLRVIARYGVGVDGVDLEAARQCGIVVTNTPQANSTAVAELTLGLMLALARNIFSAAESTRRGEWLRLSGTSLEGKTVGLIGFGSIGQRVAKRLSAFDCRVIAHDPFADAPAAEGLGVALMPLAEVLRLADFLSLHCPLLPETQGMVNAAFLAQMKPGAFLINAARGELLDETALYEALVRKHLRGAALDAFAQQPPLPSNPLLTLPQVIATPHMGAHTDGAMNAMGWGALEDCLAVLSGEQPANRVV
jgi:D-3-phosphoglycerate dehydrogenase